MEKFFILGGLPRSFSTGLQSLLWQNPDIATSSTSGLLDVVNNTIDIWDKIASHQTYNQSKKINYYNHEDVSYQKKLQVLRAIFNSYHSEHNRPFVIDKNRAWLGKISLLEAIFEEPVKMLVTVRDPRDILASLERIYQSNKGLVFTSQQVQNPLDFETLEGRLKVFSRNDEILGRPYNLLKESLRAGYRERMYFVEFERITTTPDIVMREIYDFLEIPFFQHDFDNIVTPEHLVENDRIWNAPYHPIPRSKIEPVPPQWPKYLGKLADKYKNLELW